MPVRELRLALLAAFFSFAPIGFLMQMVHQPPGNWFSALGTATVSGTIAVSWAAAFIFRKYWVIPLILLGQIALPPVLFRMGAAIGLVGFLTRPEDMTDKAYTTALMFHRGQLAAGAVVCIVIGYVLLHRFIGSRERRAQRAEAELEMAAQIHRTLVPPLEIRTPRLEVFGRSTASGEMGGDLLDALVQGDRVDLCVADVSGHGVKAGVVMGLVKGALRMRLKGGGELGDLARDLNGVLASTIEPGMFVTAVWLRFEGASAAIAVITGHPPVYQYRAADGGVVRHDNEAFPLGIADDAMVGEKSIPSAPGDVFLVYTDGIPEVFGKDGRQFGYERIADILRANAGADLRAIHTRILEAAGAHGPQTDDQTVLLARVIG